MRVTILDFVARLMGIQFHIYGLPFGANYRRSARSLASHKTLAKWGPSQADLESGNAGDSQKEGGEA